MAQKMSVNVRNLTRKVEFYESVKRLVIEILVEVISGVIAKLISGGRPGLQIETSA